MFSLIHPWIKTLSTNAAVFQASASEKDNHPPLTVLSEDEKITQETGTVLKIRIITMTYNFQFVDWHRNK